MFSPMSCVSIAARVGALLVAALFAHSAAANEVLRWNNTGYTYLKRQSAEDPRQWVSLTRKAPANSGTVAAGAAKE